MKLKSLLLGCFALAFSALVHAAEPRAGVEYTIFAPPQPVEAAPGKIEVTEFFFYTCPHCADMEPVLEQWAKALPADVSLRRVPVLFRPQLVPAAKIFYTLENMGLIEKLHALVFIAIHQERVNLMDEDTLFKWVGSKGVDAEKFASVYKSFAIASKVQRADQVTRAHGIPGTPALVVNGKYLVANGDHAAQLRVVDFLVAKERAALKGKSK